MQISAESVLALAPDAASAKAANGLTKPGQWPLLGANEAAVWGECQGSSRYQTQVDLSGPSFRCSCPSRKFPCKHGLALLLLWAKSPALFQTGPSPAWVSEWLASRTERSQKKEEKQREKAAEKAADPNAAEAALKTAQKRWARIDKGVAELQQWLLDQAAQGLGHLTPDSQDAWDAMAARLVDAQAPGLAQRLRYAAATLFDGPHWPENVLRRLGLLQLACDAVARRTALGEGAIADVRALLGWPLDKDAVLAQASPVRDQWQVMGVIQEEREGGLLERRVWLHGLHTGQRALVLDHAFAGRAFEQAWMCPATVDAALAFYPSAAPLRALVAGAGSEADAAPAAQGAGTSTPAQEWHAVARRMADNPWGFLHPLRCHDATMAHDADHFYLHWGTAVLPLQLRQADGWTLLALGAGHALTVQGEWDGQALRPLSAHSPEGVWIWSPA